MQKEGLPQRVGQILRKLESCDLGCLFPHGMSDVGYSESIAGTRRPVYIEAIGCMLYHTTDAE